MRFVFERGRDIHSISTRAIPQFATTLKSGVVPAASLVVCTVVILLLQAHVLAAPSDDQLKLAAANSDFAFKLLKQLAKEQPGSNIFISPYSASTALQMVCNGAAGQTRAEMRQVLGTSGLEAAVVNEANLAIDVSLNSGNTNVILTTANAIWYHKGTSVKPAFIACNQKFFGATIDGLDFDDPHSADVVNAWATEKTHGRINDIAGGMTGPPTALFLANAVYFKGKWDEPFDAKSTKDRMFHLQDGRQKKTPMMEDSRRFTYRRGTDYQAVRLPYHGWSLAMYVFLPDAGSGPDKLLGIMDGDKWQRVTEPGFKGREGHLVLPRFKLEYGVELKRPLQALGMRAAFDVENADFSGIAARQLFVSAVRQKAFVEVNEEGTEAAAVTAVAIPGSIEMEPPKPFEMIVDRPFLFLIEDQQTRTILFMGIVFDP